MAGWDTRFFDDFDDNSIGIQQDAQNGTITEPVGTELVLSGSAGTMCRWDSAGRDRPCGYEEISTHEAPGGGLLRFEAKVSSFTKTGVEVIAGLCLWGPTSEDAYLSGWYDSNDDVYFQRLLGGTDWITRWSGGNYGNPNSTPHIYRIYVNRTGREVFIAEYNQWLDPYTLAFQFSANNGSSWVWAYEEALAFIPTRFGVYSRNWSSGGYRGFDVGFDYLKFEQDADLNTYLGDQEEGTGTQDSTQTHDEMDLPGAGGPKGHGDQISKGQRVPGPSHQTTGSQGPFDEVQVQEEVSRLSPGGEAYGVEDGQGESAPAELVQVEDSLLVQVVDADFLQEKDDSDGKELLSAGDVRTIAVAEMDEGGFGNPVANLIYGYGQDGLFYNSGVVVSSGPFSDASSILARHWQDRSVEPGRHAGIVGNITVFGADNIRFSGTNTGGAVWDSFAFLNSHRWFLTGDFEVTLDCTNFIKSTGSPTQLEFRFNARAWHGNTVDLLRCITVIRDSGSRNWRRDTIVNGGSASNVWESSGGVPTGAYSLKIKRTGTTVECLYDSGGGWTSMGGSFSGSTSIGTDPVYFELQLAGYQTGCNGQIDLSNFTIVSGSESARASWYREASGADRGTQVTAPDDALIVAPDGSMEILDTAQTKMWMRFLQATSYMFGTTRIRRVRWKKAGWILTAQGSVGGSNGSLKLVSLTGDARTQINTSGRESFKGFIESRNSARGEWTAVADVTLPSNSVLDCDAFMPDALQVGDEVFLAAATSAGMAMIKLEAYHSQTAWEYSLSSETTEMHWCALDPVSGELFYMDTDKMYSRDKTGGGQGWEDWMTGGSWTKEYEKSLPGTRAFEFQYRAERYSSFLFMPANEGIYRVNWPSGSWELFYGKTGSGATHEILPDYKLITSITFGNDGTNNLLIAALEQERRGQIVAIKLADDSIYSKSEIVDLKVPSVIAA